MAAVRVWSRHERVLVRFASDPVLQHERIVLAHVGNDIYLVWTPDRDIHHIRLAVPPLLGLVAYGPHLEILEEVAADALYLMRDGAAGDPTEQEIVLAAEAATRMVSGARVERGFSDLRAGEYRVVFAVGPHSFGEVMVPVHGDWEQGLFCTFRRGEHIVVGEFVVTGGTSAWKQHRDPGDLRTMDIIYDMSSGERYRTMEQVAADSAHEEFADWPMDGSRDAGWVLRALRRKNQTFLQHHAAWVARSGIRDGDRVIHEHGTLCRCLHLLCTYDQVRISNLAGAEAMVKRMALIEEAYRGRASAPSYEGAEHMLGLRDTMDETLINPEVRKHTAARMKEEAEIHKERRKLAEERSLGGAHSGGAPARGGGLKGRGRGGEAPPQEK